MTYLTSLGVPAVFRILTTACTPLQSSNARNDVGASTRIHNKVSRTTEGSGINEALLACVCERADVPAAGVFVSVVVRGVGDDA